jgi:hypothetical protein
MFERKGMPASPKRGLVCVLYADDNGVAKFGRRGVACRKWGNGFYSLATRNSKAKRDGLRPAGMKLWVIR